MEAQTIGYKDTLGGAKVKECRTLKEAEVRHGLTVALLTELFMTLQCHDSHSLHYVRY